MASTFEEAREANRRAQAALTDRDRQKAAAATRDPQADTFAEAAARVKRAGDGAFYGTHPDATYAQASGKQRKT